MATTKAFIAKNGLNVVGNSTTSGTTTSTGVLYLGSSTATAGGNGQIRFYRDTGVQGWVAGVDGAAAGVNWILFDIVGNATRLQVAPDGTLTSSVSGTQRLQVNSTGANVTGGLTVSSGATVTGAIVVRSAVSGNPSLFTLADASGTAGLELGRTDGTVSSPYIDFHSGATSTDYDVRIQSVGGTGTSAQGALQIYAASFTVNATTQLNGNLAINSSAPAIHFTETDQSGAAGKFRMVADGAAIRVDMNTAAAADFSTYATPWTIDSAGTFTTPTAPVATNSTRVASTAYVVSRIAQDAPSLTGANASGTWGISVTGTAANVTGTVAIANGGTGATTAAAAATALGHGTANTPQHAGHTLSSSYPNIRFNNTDGSVGAKWARLDWETDRFAMQLLGDDGGTWVRDLMLINNLGQASFVNTISANLGGTASSTASIAAYNGTTYGIQLIGKAAAGSWNPLTQVNDSAIIVQGGGSADASNGLVIAPWSATASGLRITTTGTTFAGLVRKSVASGVGAAGTTQGTATAITTNICSVGSATAGTATGVILPANNAGAEIIVINATSIALNVYPPSGGAVDTLAANTAFSLPAGGKIMFIATTATQYYTLNATYA